jgi:hypothetical protein
VTDESEADAHVQASAPGIVFRVVSAIDEPDVAQVQATFRRRILRAPKWTPRRLGLVAVPLRTSTLCQGAPE